MKIKWSAMGIGEGRGKMGAGVASKNRYGNYIRRNTQPVNPSTDKQAAVRATFGEFSGQWRGLSETARQTWIDGNVNFPRTNNMGDTVLLAGNALYGSLNGVLKSVTDTLREFDTGARTSVNAPNPLVVCPAPESFTEVAEVFIQTAFTDDVLTGASLEVAMGGITNRYIQVWATIPMSPGKSFIPKNMYKLVASFRTAADGQYNILPALTARIGQFQQGGGVVHFSIREVTNCGTVLEIGRVRELLEMYE